MQSNKETHSQFIILLSIVLSATILRIALHPTNFSALDAMALFCGTYFARRSTALIVVLASVWIGDIFLDATLFYPGFYWQYAAYGLTTLLGAYFLKNKFNAIRFFTVSISISLLFFTISNFGVWCSGLIYPLTFNGLITCYIAAIPFLKNTLLSDLLFGGVLFGCFETYCRATPDLIAASATAADTRSFKRGSTGFGNK